jgi:hypothetical protein
MRSLQSNLSNRCARKILGKKAPIFSKIAFRVISGKVFQENTVKKWCFGDISMGFFRLAVVLKIAKTEDLFSFFRICWSKIDQKVGTLFYAKPPP